MSGAIPITLEEHRGANTLVWRAFVEACRIAKIEPTARQRRKWQRGEGAVYLYRFAGRREALRKEEQGT